MAQIKVTYTDGTSADVSPNAYAQVAAKRRFGIEAIKAEDPEVALFAVFVASVGPAAAKDPDAFDAWLETVAHYEAVPSPDPSEATPDPTPSDTSPASP